ncbi:type II secretion system F family protein [Acetobacter sp. LMG 32666]|uniref:type II secretion system F family protein n=1 Tax=Acetobacter sp. LMG 32666 TaxID=2959295 RepID=UPI0030C8680B
MLIRYTDVDYEQQHRRNSLWFRFNALIFFNWTARSTLYQMLAVRLRIHIPETTILRMFATQAARKKQKVIPQIIDDIIYHLNHGEKLVDAFRPYVPDDEYMLMYAGAKAGTLPDALQLLCEAKGRSSAMVQASMKAVSQPLMYLGIIYVFLRILGTQILPGLVSGPMAPKHPSSSQQILIFASNLASGWYAPITLGLMLLLAFATWFSLRRVTGHIRVILERFPPWSIYRDVQGYVWITAFLSLVLAQVPDKEALRIQASAASPWLKERLEAILTNLTINGLTFPDALLSTGFEFPSPRIIDDVEANWVSKEGYIRLHDTATVWVAATEKRTIAFANKAENAFILIMVGLVVILGAACDNLGADLSHTMAS